MQRGECVISELKIGLGPTALITAFDFGHQNRDVKNVISQHGIHTVTDTFHQPQTKKEMKEELISILAAASA